MRLLVPVRDLDGFFQLALLERTGHLWRKFPRLLAGGGEIQVPVDHHGQGPDRLDEQDDGYRAGHPCHVFPQLHGAEANGLPLVLKECKTVDRVRSEMCELSENH